MIDKLFMTWNETIPNQNIDKIRTITNILQKKTKFRMYGENLNNAHGNNDL